MIKLAGLKPYEDIDIIETGLRPGEKLYEELLIKSEDLKKTDNDMIFIETDKPYTRDEITEMMLKLKGVLDGSNDDIKRVLKDIVPTYENPDIVNSEAEKSEEMRRTYERPKLSEVEI
jgi:FlaA1/EpsC-like NDP-sugar epimerase